MRSSAAFIQSSGVVRIRQYSTLCSTLGDIGTIVGSLWSACSARWPRRRPVLRRATRNHADYCDESTATMRGCFKSTIIATAAPALYQQLSRAVMLLDSGRLMQSLICPLKTTVARVVSIQYPMIPLWYHPPALGSLTAAWVRYCTANFTGSTSPTECFSSWQWQFIGVWTAAHRRTCRTAVFRPSVSTLGRTCVPPTVNCFQYLATDSTLTVVGPFLSFTVWNSLPDFIQRPTISADCFIRLLKTYLFARY